MTEFILNRSLVTDVDNELCWRQLHKILLGRFGLRSLLSLTKRIAPRFHGSWLCHQHRKCHQHRLKILGYFKLRPLINRTDFSIVTRYNLIVTRHPKMSYLRNFYTIFIVLKIGSLLATSPCCNSCLFGFIKNFFRWQYINVPCLFLKETIYMIFFIPR